MKKLNLDLAINFLTELSQDEIEELIEDITSYVLNNYNVSGVGYDSNSEE